MPRDGHVQFGERVRETGQPKCCNRALVRLHQRVGRPHVATWAETETVLAAELVSGNDDPRAGAARLLRRALAALPGQARAGRVRLRADAGYFAGELARAAFFAGVQFAIGAKRIAPLWRLLAGLSERDWAEAIDMDGAQVAVADYRPDWWPAKTFLLIRRVRLDIAQVSADPRSRRRRTLHPDQRVLPIAELAEADAIYAYSFILTNLDVSTPDKAAVVEHWYRHRTSIENVFRDSKHGAALRHLPSGYVGVNTAWMWGALLAATMAGWLHQLTATEDRFGRLSGWGHPRGQGDDRDPAPAPDQRPWQAWFPCGADDPASATRTGPARRDSRAAAPTARRSLTVRLISPDPGFGDTNPA